MLLEALGAYIELVVGDGDTDVGGHMLLSSGLSSSTMYGFGGDIVLNGSSLVFLSLSCTHL